MKRIALFALMIFSLLAGAAAQDDADRAYKKAKRALSAYNLDPSANADKLREARENIIIALGNATIQADPEAWILSGQIAIEEANKDLTAAVLNPNAKAAHPRAALDGFEAFKEGLKRAEKRFHKKDAIKGINDIMGHLNNMSILGYQTENLQLAHSGFCAIVEANDLIAQEGEKSPLDEKSYLDVMFSAAATCNQGGDAQLCLTFMEKLRAANYSNAYLYDMLYNTWIESDKDKAVSYLAEGRKKFPEEVSLLFTEINHYLREGRLDELVGKLKMAIEKEPDNKSLYLTLGNVYDNLFQKSLEAKEEEQGEAHFNAALSYYEKALELDPKYIDATYSVGALYYNRAAVYQQSLNALADDYSKAGIARYDAMKAKQNAEFDKALPYFQRAEQLDPNDLNTLIALKEIFARKNDATLSNEFKVRLENVQKGTPNTGSYFK